MLNDQKVISFASEYLPFINIPEELLAYLGHMEKKLSGTDILVYLYYWRKWRYKDFEVVISNQDLADQLGVHVSSVKRANEKLVEAGLIRRKLQKRKSKSNKTENLPSITLPAVPRELVEHFKSSPMRKPYRDPETHREITSFAGLLQIAESNDAHDGNGSALKPEDIKQSIAKLFANKEIDTGRYDKEALFSQVAWSIYDGQLSDPEFETDKKRLSVAIKLIKTGTWEKPKKFPAKYIPKGYPTNMPPRAPSEDIDF